ncbi:MAG: winged helix-turn-helix domain-containing protein, partial [Elusimicrobiota bacterium]
VTRALLLISDPGLAARLGRLLRGLGCSFQALAHPAAHRDGAEIVLAAWGALGRDPKAAVKRLSKRTGKVLLFLDPGEFFGSALSKAVSCGAADVLNTDSGDPVLAGRIAAALAGSQGEGEVLLSSAGDLRVERARRRVSRRKGRGWVDAGPLSPREFDLLCFFLEHPGAALSRATLLERIWGRKAADVNPETVDRHVGSLRRRLGSAGDIRPLRGFGYRFGEGAAAPKL